MVSSFFFSLSLSRFCPHQKPLGVSKQCSPLGMLSPFFGTTIFFEAMQKNLEKSSFSDGPSKSLRFTRESDTKASSFLEVEKKKGKTHSLRTPSGGWLFPFGQQMRNSPTKTINLPPKEYESGKKRHLFSFCRLFFAPCIYTHTSLAFYSFYSGFLSLLSDL